MKVRELAIPGAWEITPTIHGDSRGYFFEWLTDRGFTGFAGHRLDVRQANCSVSSAGVLRGMHFAQVPPSQAKYVTCLSGSVFDVVVDVRVGSPTFGRWDSVLLDDTDRRTIYISEGLAHGFLALEDNSTSDVPLLVGIQPATRAHHLRHGSDSGDRLAVIDGVALRCPTATPRPPASTKYAPPASCRPGKRRRHLSAVCG